MTSKRGVTLTDLPPATLDRIVADSLSVGTRPLALLSQLGSTVSQATQRVLARTLTLPDDDQLLVLIERELELGTVGTRRGSHLVTAVAAIWDPALVLNLQVVPPPSATASASAQAQEVSEVPPLDDHGLLLLVDRFANLSSFAWRSYRLPPDDLCLDLANAAKNLREFTFDLAPAPFPFSTSTSSPVPEPHSSPTLGSCPTSPGGLHAPSHALSLRWDSPSLSSLPGTLTSLTLSSLSHAGVRELSTSLSSFFALERLELSKTVFVDDALLREVSQALAKTLKKFTIRDMTGTKLSDVGIGSLLEGCGELEEFEMDCVEGRLSKSCWSKVIIFPPRLRSVKMVYSESPPHKSWVIDHLQSSPALLSVPSLTSFALLRKVHPEALIPGSHHPTRHPVDPLLVPRKITRDQIEAITGGPGDEGQGKRWIDLDLDLCLVDSDALKKLLDGCPDLKRLRVCFDSEFKNLLSLSSSFSACLHLQRFAVTIPLEHAPELQTLTPATYRPSIGSPASSLAGSPPAKSNGLPISPSNSPRKSVSDLAPSASASEPALPECIQSLVPATRDWRRFLKKSHSLSSITWNGRGGIGRFNFGKVEGKGLIKVAFEPTRPLVVASSSLLESLGGGGGGGGHGLDAYEGGGARDRQDSWTSTLSFSSSSSSSLSNLSTLFGAGPPRGGVGHVGATPITRRRASSSSSSVATTAPSPVWPAKSLGHGGGGTGGRAVGRKYGSIDAAFSPSVASSSSPSGAPHRRASTAPASSTFGVIGPAKASRGGGGGGGGGNTTKRKPSFEGGQIGSGWSGFHAPTPTSSVPEEDAISPSASPASSSLSHDPFYFSPSSSSTSSSLGTGASRAAPVRGGGLEMNFGPRSSFGRRLSDDARSGDAETLKTPRTTTSGFVGHDDDQITFAPTLSAVVATSGPSPSSTLTTTTNNPWNSVPSSVTSAAPCSSSSSSSAAIGWASKTPTPPRAPPTNGGDAKSSSKSNGGGGGGGGPSSTKMSRGSRSSSSSAGGGGGSGSVQGSPNSSRSGTRGEGSLGSNTAAAAANKTGTSTTAVGGESLKKEGGRKRRDRGSGRQGNVRKKEGGGGINA